MKQTPAYIEIDKNGDKHHYSDRGMTVLHRTDGPAIEWSNGAKEWWQNDQRHRTDGPAIEHADGTKEWWQNGQRHRVDGPAVEWSHGTKVWYVNGQLHRVDGPAVEYANGRKEWWQNDQRHRIDGPAIEWSDGDKAWYIDGEYLTEAQFRAATAPKVIHELTLDDIAARLGIAAESLKIVKEH